MKRVVGLILLFTMMFSLLTGCGGTTDEIPDEMVTLKVGIPQLSTVSSYRDNKFTSYLEEKANVKIEFVSYSSSATEYKQQLALLCAAQQEMPDVLLGFEFDSYLTNQYGEDGYFLELTDYIEKYADNYKAQLENIESDEVREYVVEKGKNLDDNGIYGMPRVMCTATDDLQSLMYINQKWLDKLGLQIPRTTEELQKVLNAFATQDPNGNGEKDEIPMLGKDDLCYYLINAFVYYDSGTYNVTDGKVWDPVTTDEFRQALIYANKLVKSGLYSPMSFTLTSNTDFKGLISPTKGPTKVGVFEGAPVNLTNETSDVTTEYVALPPLEDATGKGGYTVVKEPSVVWSGFITKDCEYPAVAMKFLDLFYTDEAVSFQRHGQRDVDWKYEEGTNTLGTKSYVNAINSQAFFEGNSTWCKNMLGIMTHWNYQIVAGNEATDRAKDLNRLRAECWDIITNGKTADERCTYMVYTTEEYEVREEKASIVQDYIRQEILDFVAGEKDPANDAVWNEYLSTLTEIGRPELLDIAQNAFDRK